MVGIRLSRHGAKKRPFYHIVVTDRRNKRNGRFIERLGFYNPIATGGEQHLKLALNRVDYWLGQGAQPSERVRQLIRRRRMEGDPAGRAAQEAAVADEAPENVAADVAAEPAPAEEAKVEEASEKEAVTAEAAEEEAAQAETEGEPAADAAEAEETAAEELNAEEAATAGEAAAEEEGETEQEAAAASDEEAAEGEGETEQAAAEAGEEPDEDAPDNGGAQEDGEGATAAGKDSG